MKRISSNVVFSIPICNVRSSDLYFRAQYSSLFSNCAHVSCNAASTMVSSNGSVCMPSASDGVFLIIRSLQDSRKFIDIIVSGSSNSA